MPSPQQLALRLPLGPRGQPEQAPAGRRAADLEQVETLGDEARRRWIVQRLADARRSVRGGMPHSALAALDDLQAHYPGHERRYTALRWRIEALCQQGALSDARAIVKAERNRSEQLPQQLRLGLQQCPGL